MLFAPNTELPFILDRDASNTGLGAVLSQLTPDGEWVVAYHSRTLDKSERNYCVTRKDLLAVIDVVNYFKHILCGLPFTIRTDHAALKWLMSFKEPEGQVARWIEQLQAFQFTIQHRAGESHTMQTASPADRVPQTVTTVTGKKNWRHLTYRRGR